MHVVLSVLRLFLDLFVVQRPSYTEINLSWCSSRWDA